MAEPTCVFDALPASAAPLFLIDGLWLCSLHAQCATCHLPLIENVGNPKGIGCVCHNYGYSGHEEDMFCSVECMDAAHPDAYDLARSEDEADDRD